MSAKEKPQSETLSVAEACAIAGVGVTTLYSLMAKGSLEGRKIGRKTVIMRKEMMRFLDTLPRASIERELS